MRRHSGGIPAKASSHVVGRPQPALVVVQRHVQMFVRRTPHAVLSCAGDAPQPPAHSHGPPQRVVHIRCAVPALSNPNDMAIVDSKGKRLLAESCSKQFMGCGESAECGNSLGERLHSARIHCARRNPWPPPQFLCNLVRYAPNEGDVGGGRRKWGDVASRSTRLPSFGPETCRSAGAPTIDGP